jgi:hypothetical protein
MTEPESLASHVKNSPGLSKVNTFSLTYVTRQHFALKMDALGNSAANHHRLHDH